MCMQKEGLVLVGLVFVLIGMYRHFSFVILTFFSLLSSQFDNSTISTLCNVTLRHSQAHQLDHSTAVQFSPLCALAADSKVILNKPTKEHIEGLYSHHFIYDLMNVPQNQDLYLEVVFAHFRSDFQDWPNSHWPTLLQDLQLLPIHYCTQDARQVHRLMRDVWERQHEHLQPDPIEHYHQTAVRVPPLLAHVFQHDVPPHYNSQTKSALYQFLVREMQRFADDYPATASNSIRKRHRISSTGRLHRFKAIYWLTVLDKFIGTVQRMNPVDGVLQANPFPRTVFIRQDPNLAAQHSLARPAGPSGSIPVRRAPSAAAGASNRGTKRKATGQGGGPSQGGKKKGPGGSMRSMDGAPNEPQVGLRALQSNSGGSCTAMSWVSVIMVTIAVSLISFA